MRLIPIFIIAAVLAVTGWWLRHEGPERWPNERVTSIESIAPTPKNENVNVPRNVNGGTTLPAPNDLTATVNGTEVTIAWSAVNGAYGYSLTRNDTFIGIVYGTKFIDFALTPGTAYSYSVATVNEMNVTTSELSTIAATTTDSVAATTPAPTSTTTNIPKPTNTNRDTNTSKPATNTNTAPKPTPTPTPTPKACGQGGACTAADVASHNTRSNCWVYLNPLNKVYNITAYVRSAGQHPGGDVIVPYCGRNIYGPFEQGTNGGKRHSTYALNSVLQAYYIGPFQP